MTPILSLKLTLASLRRLRRQPDGRARTRRATYRLGPRVLRAAKVRVGKLC